MGSPECPQEEYVYDYQYAGSDTGHGNESANNNIEDNIIEDEYDYDVVDSNNEIEPVVLPPSNNDYAPSEYDDNNVDAADEDYAEVVGDNVCPGGDLETCVDVCPGQYGARVFGLCVASCGKRCP